MYLEESGDSKVVIPPAVVGHINKYPVDPVFFCATGSLPPVPQKTI